MNKQQKKLIKRMNKLKELIPATIEAIDDLPDVGDLYTALDPGELRIALGYRLNKYLSLRRILAKKWQYRSHRFNELNGNYYVYFRHKKFDEIKLSLELEFPKEFENNAVCRVIEVGHKTEVIYGLECK
jgi:hypothetical protein